MSGIGELQTVSAILDLLQLTYKAGQFLKHIHDAPKIAIDIGDAIGRLDQVLENVRAILKTRTKHEGLGSDTDANVVSSIGTTVKACYDMLRILEGKVGRFDVSQKLASSMVEWVRTVCHQPTIRRMQHDLDVRVGVLQTNLIMLQLCDQNRAQETLMALRVQVEHGNQMLSQLIEETRKPAQLDLNRPFEAVMECSGGIASQDAIASLEKCLLEAEDVQSQHEPFNSLTAFGPDYDMRCTSPSVSTGTSSPRSRSSSFHSPCPSSPLTSASDSGSTDALPLPLLNDNIQVCIERATKERMSGNLQQAEENISRAIGYSDMRHVHYGIVLEDKASLQEERATIYLKQGRFGEAIARLHQLLRDGQPPGFAEGSVEAGDLAQARQNQLLASVYYERYLCHANLVESRQDEDMEHAEKHAWKALTKRHKLSMSSAQPAEDGIRECADLLIRILESNGKTPEAHVMRKWRSKGSALNDGPFGMSFLGSGMDRADKFNLLILAITHQDGEKTQELIEGGDIDLESTCRHGKTPLMHAVEHGESGVLHKLLDPEVGANADTADKHGMTACHLAAKSGHLASLRVLLNHGADTDRRDSKGETALVKAVRAGHVSIVRHLFNERPDSFRARTSDGWSMLHHAIRNGDTTMTGVLLDLSPDLKDATDSAGKTALHHAVESGRLGQVSALLGHKHRSSVNTVDSVLRTPLYLATSKPMTCRRESMVRLLLEHGAQVREHRSAPWSTDYKALRQEKPRRRTV